MKALSNLDQPRLISIVMLSLRLLAFVLVSSASASTEVEQYSYLGIQFGVTVEELKVRYPLSSVQFSRLKLVESESHDHVSGISVYASRVLVSFEMKDEEGRNIYPACRTVFNQIFKDYGGPHVVQRRQIETTPVHRRIWKNGRARMRLLCFEREGNRLAERVDLYEE